MKQNDIDPLTITRETFVELLTMPITEEDIDRLRDNIEQITHVMGSTYRRNPRNAVANHLTLQIRKIVAHYSIQGLLNGLLSENPFEARAFGSVLDLSINLNEVSDSV